MYFVINIHLDNENYAFFIFFYPGCQLGLFSAQFELLNANDTDLVALIFFEETVDRRLKVESGGGVVRVCPVLGKVGVEGFDKDTVVLQHNAKKSVFYSRCKFRVEHNLR